MARFRLRYLATDMELPVGEFVIGRSSSCNLSLDDALVSRRHAVLEVTEEGVTVDDLGSRNGVLVNGERIEGRRELRHLDRVTIGSQDMVLMEMGRRRRSAPATSDAMPCTQCGAVVSGDEAFCRKCGAAAPRRGMPTLAGATMELKIPLPGTTGAAPDEVTQKGSGLALLASLADKALALKRFEEAERILGKHLDGILDGARQKQSGSEELVRHATSYALRLAEGLGKARWIDWVFELHAAARLVVPSEDVEKLHQLVRRTRYDDPRALRDYLAAIRPRRQEMSAAERFVVQRLEGLERVISA